MKKTLLTVYNILLFFFGFAQGDFCSTAVELTNGTFTADGPASGMGCHNCSPGTAGSHVFAEHADWYKFTAPGNGIINIESCLGGADTRLWVYEGDCNNLVDYLSNDDACDLGGGEIFAAALTNMAVLGGNTYYFEWDDAWDRNSFDFSFEYKAINVNVGLEKKEYKFTKLPLQQSSGGIDLSAVLVNSSATPIQDLMVFVEVYDNMDSITSLHEDSILVSMLNVNETMNLSLNPWTPSQFGSYYVKQYVQINLTDEEPSDNTVFSNSFEITNSEYALDECDGSAGAGIAGPGLVRFGQRFEFFAHDSIFSLYANILGGQAGDTLEIEIWETFVNSNRPFITPIYTSTYVMNGTEPDWIEFPLDSLFEVFPQTAYMFSLTHHARGVALNLGISPNVFQPRNAWIAIGAGSPWTPLELISDPATGQPFEYAFGIRLLNEPAKKDLTFRVDMGSEVVNQEGVFVQYHEAGEAILETELFPNHKGIYTATVEVNSNSTVYYRYSNGETTPSLHLEGIPFACAVTDDNGAQARKIEIESMDVVLDKVCFGSCEICTFPPCDEPTAIICDDFEHYNLGELAEQSFFWRLWDATSEDPRVVGTIYNSPEQSLQIKGSSSNGGLQDLLLQLYNETEGNFTLEWNMYVPSNRAAFYNVQHSTLLDHVWGAYFYFDVDGSGEIAHGTSTLKRFNYSQNQWIKIRHEIDLDNDWIRLFIDDEEIFGWKFSLATDSNGNNLPDMNQLAAFNFYPLDLSYEFYIDDVLYALNPSLIGNTCASSINVDDLATGDFDEIISSDPFNNTQNHSGAFDPSIGYDCFTETGNLILNNTMWFDFIGDGATYKIEAVNCDPSDEVNLQMALFKGNCNAWLPVVCSEYAASDSSSNDVEFQIQTTNGVQYYLMVDGNSTNLDLAKGIFCIHFTKVMDPINEVNLKIKVDMTQWLNEGNSISSEGIHLNGSLTSDVVTPMQNTGNNIWEYVTQKPEFTTQYYNFYNGITEVENTDGLVACGIDDGADGYYRYITISDTDLILDTVCFSSCSRCDSTTNTVRISNESWLEIYPNPAHDMLEIKTDLKSNSISEIKIYNSLGVLIETVMKDSPIHQINTSNYLPGLYYLELNLKYGLSRASFQKL